MLVRRWPVLALAGWSAFIWITRISNVTADAEASGPTKAWTIALSASLLALAAAGLAIVVRAWRRPLATGERRVLQVFAGWTTVVWIVRAGGIVISDHEVPFKVVHVALGVVSIALAALTWRVATRADRSDPLDQPDPLDRSTGDEAGTSAVSPGRELAR